MEKGTLTVCEGIAVLIHDIVVVGPIIATSLTVARFLAAERALGVLKDPDAEKSLVRLCTCGESMQVDGLIGDDDFSDETGDAEEVAAILTAPEDIDA